MFLYLVRHGEAMGKEEDPSRGLSETGAMGVEKVAAYMARKGVGVNRILHSGKLRAMQTARIFFDALEMEDNISETDGLAPMDDPKIWYERISNMDEDIMLVGHLPFMGLFSGLLLSGDKAGDSVEFRAGSIACFKSGNAGKWSLEWKIAPEEVK